MKKISLIFISIVSALALTSCTHADPNPALTIEGGMIKGVETATPGIIAYKGIPFAAPPISELRWKEPQPVIPWEGVKIADSYGAASMQVTWNPESFYGREWRASGSVPFSEDCLYLNVWTPAAGQPDKKLPVAMWIHGGGLREGFGFEPEMDGGEDFASRGVIYVSITYRLGVLGFFSHPLLSAESPNGVSGNYGAMDQAAALKWIKHNIAQFGGDPDNITIFGQSAGGRSVQTLCASPQSRSMIAKAISMSSGGLTEPMPSTPFDTIQFANKAMMDYFGKNTLAEMRALSFDELTNMTTEYATSTGKRLSFGFVVDNYFLTGSFSDMVRAGQIPNIPYIFGFTANDGSDASKPIRDFCLLREQQGGKPAYAYLFTRQLPGDESGAFHSSDLWYVFHSFRHSWRPFTAGDEALSLKMVDFWTNFAKYGNPNGQGTAVWTPCTSVSPKFMVLDANETEAIFTMTDNPQYLGPSLRR